MKHLICRRWVLATGILTVGMTSWLAADWYFGMPEGRVPVHVGRSSCAECHMQQVEAFAGSDHDRAMDVATAETVLGNFDEAEVTHHGVSSRMFRRGKQFFVEMEGPDGKPAEYEVKYVFGADPLQQYLVEHPGVSGEAGSRAAGEISETAAAGSGLPRMQVLPMAWDVPKQRWYFVIDDPQASEPGDLLHWAGWTQNWNHMCARCHSTDLRKNYHVESSRFHTTFSEIDVSCEACHGPADMHVEIAVLGPAPRLRARAVEGREFQDGVADVCSLS
jgi:hypothetical protein